MAHFITLLFYLLLRPAISPAAVNPRQLIPFHEVYDCFQIWSYMIKCEQLITSRRQPRVVLQTMPSKILKVGRVEDMVSPPIFRSTVAKWEKSLEPDGLFIKFKQQITNFHWRFIYSMFIIQVFLLFYVLFISFILSSWDKRIQRYIGRGKTGLGK